MDSQLSERQHTYVVPDERKRAHSEIPVRDPPTSLEGTVQPDGGGMIYSPRRELPPIEPRAPQLVDERQTRQPWSRDVGHTPDAPAPPDARHSPYPGPPEEEGQGGPAGSGRQATYAGFVPITPPEGKQRRPKPPQIPRRLQTNNARQIGRQQAPLPPVGGTQQGPPPESDAWSAPGANDPESDNPYYDGAQFTGEPYGPDGFIDVPTYN